MSEKQKAKLGKQAREFVINFCSIDSVCSKFEKIISKMKPTSWDFDFSYVLKNESYVPPEIKDDREWVIDLYKNILNVDAKNDDINGINHWVHRLKSDLNRQSVYDYFINTAREENSANRLIPFDDLLDKNDKGKRILFVLPQNEIDIFNSTSLLKFIKDKYPDHNIYYATKKEYFDILSGNQYIHKLVPYDPIMENFVWAEGQGSYSGFFEFALMPHVNTNKFSNFMHGNKHQIEYDINYA